MKFGHIAALLDYMNATLKSMHEAWEDLLLMMETKLANYSSVSDSVVSLAVTMQGFIIIRGADKGTSPPLEV